MAGWHHWLDGRESQWTLGVGGGHGGLACCNSWGRKESDTTERLIWSDLIWFCNQQRLEDQLMVPWTDKDVSIGMILRKRKIFPDVLELAWNYQLGFNVASRWSDTPVRPYLVEYKRSQRAPTQIRPLCDHNGSSKKQDLSIKMSACRQNVNIV